MIVNRLMLSNRPVICLFFVLLLSNAITAQEMTPKQEKEFALRSLNVTVTTSISGYIFPPGSFITPFSGVLFESWQGTEGFQKLTEFDFYSKAGFVNVANEALAHRIIYDVSSGVAGAGALAGIVLILSNGTGIENFSPFNSDLITTGTFLFLGSLLLGLIPASMDYQSTTPEQARMAANAYNTRVRFNITAKYN